jgi:RNase adaptor protein for sRNA GlmZ degradation
MATLSIENFPDQMIRSIELRAEKERTTIRSVVIRALTNHVDSNTANAVPHTVSEPMQKALVQIQVVFAELERSMLVARLRESREQTKTKLGRCEGRKPYGHYASEAPILAQIRSMRDSGMTHDRIASTLDSRGIPARLGGNWRAAVISKILRRG